MDKDKYERAFNFFSADGSVDEIEKAKRAVKTSKPSIGITYDIGLVLLSCTESGKSSLLKKSNLSNVFMISENVGMVASGLLADAQSLASNMRDKAMEDIEMYGQVEDVNVIAKELSKDIRDTSQEIMSRPYGIAAIVGGRNSDGSTEIYKIGVDGSMSNWRACAVGSESDQMIEHMEQEYPVNNSGEALNLSLECARLYDEDISANNLCVTVISEGTGFKRLDNNEISNALNRVNIDE